MTRSRRRPLWLRAARILDPRYDLAGQRRDGLWLAETAVLATMCALAIAALLVGDMLLVDMASLSAQ